jgi:hypothetical protein
MKKSMKFGLLLALVAILAIGLIGTGAWWEVQTQATGNNFTAGTFNVTIGNQHTGDTGTQTVSGTWVSPANWVPGGDYVPGTIYIYNKGSVPVNVVLSGLVLADGSTPLANWICLTAFTDSNGGVAPSPYDDLADLKATPQFVDPLPGAGCVTLSKFVSAMNGGWFNANHNNDGIFIPVGGYAQIDMSFGFATLAGNDTIGKTAGFTWTLTAKQVPVNTIPAP